MQGRDSNYSKQHFSNSLISVHELRMSFYIPLVQRIPSALSELQKAKSYKYKIDIYSVNKNT